jgi:hypothetical protein
LQPTATKQEAKTKSNVNVFISGFSPAYLFEFSEHKSIKPNGEINRAANNENKHPILRMRAALFPLRLNELLDGVPGTLTFQ